MGKSTELEYWVCKNCKKEKKVVKNKHPKKWTYTEEHGLICEECSSELKVKVENTWETL